MIVVKRIKKTLLALAFVLLSASGAFASAVSADVRSPDVALADAGIVRQTIDTVERMVLPREFEAAFGKPVETQNMGANVYRNLDWRVALVSTDRSLDLHVGFNYGKMAEWSMSLDFGDDALAARRYFVALSRGFEQLTGHLSPVIRTGPSSADLAKTPAIGVYYPLGADRMLSVSAAAPTDGTDFVKIFLVPTSAVAADHVMARVKSGDTIPVGSLDIGLASE